MEGTHLPVRRLRLPRKMLWDLSFAIVRNAEGSLRRDSAMIVSALGRQWVASGVEHLPASGAACLVLNHWQRPGLWIGWEGALLGWLVNQRRPSADPPVRWLVLSDLRWRLLGRERHLWPVDIVLGRVAYAWGMIPISASAEGTAARAAALRRLDRSIGRGEVTGFFPEGHHGTAGPLGSPAPGALRVLAWLARRGAALVPVGAWEAEGRLHASIGPPIFATTGDITHQIMPAIAAQLPPHLRGAWAPSSQPAPASTDQAQQPRGQDLTSTSALPRSQMTGARGTAGAGVGAADQRSEVV